MKQFETIVLYVTRDLDTDLAELTIKNIRTGECEKVELSIFNEIHDILDQIDSLNRQGYDLKSFNYSELPPFKCKNHMIAIMSREVIELPI